LLADLFGTVLVPPAVVREAIGTVGRTPWLIERPLAHPLPTPLLRSQLGPGETEVIGLALELGRRVVILDERAGRRLASRLGLDVVGTIAVLLEAERRGHLAAVRPELDALLSTGFFVSPALYRQVMARSGEEIGDEVDSD
jgi:predicted nucleic acid-binding protein